MTTFVLVHGAFHGAWCWTKLGLELKRRGHRVIALDMPGCGEDRTPLSDVTLGGHASRIVDVLRILDEPATLVGHSLGTMSVSFAAEWEPQLISHLVLLGGVTPRNGMSLYALLQFLDAPDRPIKPKPSPGEPWHGIRQDPPLELVGDLYYNDCSPDDVRYALSRLRPQANAPRVTPMTLTEGRFGAVPRSFIGCSLDKANTVERQKATLALDPCDSVHVLPTSHSPFFSAPAALAELLCNVRVSDRLCSKTSNTKVAR